MRARSTVLLLLAALTLAAAAPASSSATVLAQDAAGGVAAAGDVVAWSAYDRAAGGYRLVVRRGKVTSTLPVPAAAEPFDVAAGTGPDGAVWLVWSRCAAGDCDIVRWSEADPGERRVPGAGLAAWDERHPAIDGGRIAFARSRGTVTQVVVAGIAGSPAPRVVGAALPAGLCIDTAPRERPCAAPARVVVDGVGLRGSGLAVSARAETAGGGPGLCGLAALRFVDLRTGIPRRITDTTCGLAGATIAAPSFDGRGRLWFGRACNSTRDACRGPAASPMRYDPATGASHGTRSVVDGSLRGVAATPTGLVLSRWNGVFSAACGPPTSDGGCATVSTVPVPAFTEPATSSPREPDLPLRPVRTRRRAQVLRPAAHVPCQVANPHPHPGAEIWGGAVVPEGRRATLSARVAGGRAAGRRITATYGWRFAHVTLDGRGVCGATVTVTYRITGDAPMSFRVRVDRAR